VLWLPVVWFLRLVHEDLAYCSLAVGQKIFEEEKLLLLLLLLLLPYPRRYIYIKTQRKEEMVALTSRRRALIFNVYLPQIPPFFLLLLF
jgi:hypothetical protein